MFRIDYELVDGYKIKPRKIMSLRDIDFAYDLFCGNVRLCSDTETLEMNWEWITLLDFAKHITKVRDYFNQHNNIQRVFEFTEAAEQIIYEKEGDSITISNTFNSIILKTVFKEFSNAVDKSNRELIQRIVAVNPKLIDNHVFQEYLKLMSAVSY